MEAESGSNEGGRKIARKKKFALFTEKQLDHEGQTIEMNPKIKTAMDGNRILQAIR